MKIIQMNALSLSTPAVRWYRGAFDDQNCTSEQADLNHQIEAFFVQSIHILIIVSLKSTAAFSQAICTALLI